jgi:serine/threonine protein kinase
MNADSLFQTENELLAKPISSFGEFVAIIARWMGEANIQFIPQITLGASLGKGAFAQVMLGSIPGQQQVAVKRYTNEPHQLGPDLFSAALREAIILRRLRGAPNVLQLQGVCISVVPESSTSEVWFVLDYVKGVPFSKVPFLRQKATPVETVRRALLPLACALESIHKVAVHLDLSPDNILVDSKDGSVTVIDLNGALPTKGWGHKTAVTGLVVGKHYYMAPEQV